MSAPSPEHRDRIEDVRELRFLLETVLPDADARAEWLHSSVPALRGRTPRSLIRRGRLDEVIGVLTGVESGAFARSIRLMESSGVTFPPELIRSTRAGSSEHPGGGTDLAVTAGLYTATSEPLAR